MPAHSGAAALYGTGSEPLTYEQYANLNGIEGNPNSLLNKIGNFFTGNVTSVQQNYQNYLASYESKKNQMYADKANKETWEREDTQIQRMVKDLEAAGLNPYILFNNGNISGGVSSQAIRPDYKRSSESSQKRSGNGSVLGTALKLLAILALKG